MSGKTITQSIFASLSGKTITDSKVTESGLVTLTFKSGDKISFNINLQQGLDYSSQKNKSPTKTDRLVKHAMRALATNPPGNKINNIKVSKAKVSSLLNKETK